MSNVYADPEVEDVENLDDQVSIHSVSSSTHLENTETGSASSVVLVESSNSDSSSIGEGESDISHTESSTNGESNTAESVVESLVSMVTTDSSSPADSVETEVEESSNAEDSKDCVESMISSVSDSVKVEEEFSENVTASTRKRRRQVKTEVEPKRGNLFSHSDLIIYIHNFLLLALPFPTERVDIGILPYLVETGKGVALTL